MKKFSILLLCLVPLAATAQFISESAEGKGTILANSSNISLDLAKTDVSFSLNNLNKIYDQKKKFFFGGSLKGKNEEGLGNLFAKGDFVPSSQATFFGAWRKSDGQDLISKIEEERLSQILIEQSTRISIVYAKKMTITVTDVLNAYPGLTQNAGLRKELHDLIKNQPPAVVHKYLREYRSKGLYMNDSQRTEIFDIVDFLVDKSKSLLAQLDEDLTPIRTQLIKNYTEWVRLKGWSFMLLGFGSVNGSSFKRFEPVSTTPSDNFIKEEFRGGQIGVGINFQIQRFNFGVTYAYKKTNNFHLLDKTDYKLITETVSGSQTLQTEKTITAYAGTYGELEMNELNIDATVTLTLNKKSGDYTMIDCYLRANAYSRNKDLLPNSYNLGISTLFFSNNSKFLGGLYVELPDVDDSFEKSKPVADQNIRPALRRLTFGITTKFALSSLIAKN